MTRRLRTWPFLAAAAVLTVLLASTYVFFVLTYTGQILDERAKMGAWISHASIASWADRVLDLVPLVGAGGVLVAIIIGVVRKAPALTVIALGVVAGANITTQLLKHVLLVRPSMGATLDYANSFPSGHTTVVASVAFALFLVSPPKLRRAIAVIGGACTVVIGNLLLASQWHRPSDIVGGVLVVAIWGCLGGAAAVALRLPLAAAPIARRQRALWALALGCAALSLFAFAWVSTSAAESGRHVTLAFAGGLAAICAVGAATAAGLTRLFRRLG